MSTGNDTALPTPQDQPTPTAPTNEPAAAADAQAAAVTSVDPDEADLNAAKAEAQAEKASDGATEGQAAEGQQSSDQQPAAGAQQQDQQPGQKAQVQMIPKPRFDELAQDRDRARQEAAYWQGVAKAREQQVAAPAQAGQQQQPPQQAAQTPEQKLTAIQTEVEALAQRFDNGEITMAEFTKAQRALNDREFALREEQLAAKLKPAQAQPQSDELYLNTLTAQLEDQHPWVSVMDQVGTDAEWEFLKTRAIENLVQRGIDPTAGANGRYELRKEISVLCDDLGPALVGKRAQDKGLTLPGAQAPTQNRQQQQQQQPPLSPQARARQNKLNMAAGAPPDIAGMHGHNGATPGAPPSDVAIEAMSEEEYDKLPASTRQRLLGITA